MVAICFITHACCLQAEWNFLLRGGSSLTPVSRDAATPSWLSGSQWSHMVQMGRAVPPLQDVADSMSMPSQSMAWEEWAGCSQPHLQPLPPAWEHVCTAFHRLLLLKVCAGHPTHHRIHAPPLTTTLTTRLAVQAASIVTCADCFVVSLSYCVLFWTGPDCSDLFC